MSPQIDFLRNRIILDGYVGIPAYGRLLIIRQYGSHCEETFLPKKPRILLRFGSCLAGPSQKLEAYGRQMITTS